MESTDPLVAIVDDDGPMRKSLERLLRTRGYTTAAFASAEDFLRAQPLDGVMGVVLDVNLEGMSGLDLCRRLSVDNPRLPVVIITARSDDKARAEAIGLGCVDYLEKPFAADALMGAVRRCAVQGAGAPSR